MDDPPRHIDVTDENDLRRWARHFVVSVDTIQLAVRAVGSDVQDVARQLGRL